MDWCIKDFILSIYLYSQSLLLLPQNEEDTAYTFFIIINFELPEFASFKEI